MSVWVLTIDDDHGPITTVHATREGGLREAQAYAAQLLGDDATDELDAVTDQLREHVDVYLDEHEVGP